jgi:hypothetical protein
MPSVVLHTDGHSSERGNHAFRVKSRIPDVSSDLNAFAGAITQKVERLKVTDQGSLCSD